jgi:hypothetical protein
MLAVNKNPCVTIAFGDFAHTIRLTGDKNTFDKTILEGMKLAQEPLALENPEVLSEKDVVRVSGNLAILLPTVCDIAKKEMQRYKENNGSPASEPLKVSTLDKLLEDFKNIDEMDIEDLETLLNLVKLVNAKYNERINKAMAHQADVTSQENNLVSNSSRRNKKTPTVSFVSSGLYITAAVLSLSKETKALGGVAQGVARASDATKEVCDQSHKAHEAMLDADAQRLNDQRRQREGEINNSEQECQGALQSCTRAASSKHEAKMNLARVN